MVEKSKGLVQNVTFSIYATEAVMWKLWKAIMENCDVES